MAGWLPGRFLPLLLLARLPAGLAHQFSAIVDVSIGLDVVLQCLLQTGSSSTTGELKWFNTTQNSEANQNKYGVEMKEDSAQLTFSGVNKSHTGSYACRTESTRDMPMEETENPDITMECRFEIWSENLVVHVKWYQRTHLEVGSQTNSTAPGKNCGELTSPGVCAASSCICGCGVFITRTQATDAGNGTPGTVPSCGPLESQSNVSEKRTRTAVCAGLHFLLSILFGLTVGTLLYMPIIGLLLWQRRKNRKGKLTSRQVAEGNQLSTAAPVMGTEDVTYANLKFEKRTAPTACNVVYTEMKPPQQKQGGGDAGAADAGPQAPPRLSSFFRGLQSPTGSSSNLLHVSAKSPSTTWPPCSIDVVSPWHWTCWVGWP
ncbi:uncharacterized protein LOC142362856 isoform X2 [Opisthocomus hoazin]|uniref:uncharacterized protein LOC142362856 isoform X2 n=1 Tax=Opisthocomus hoazin TaxID=30419 RepID=UPI003F539A70